MDHQDRPGGRLSRRALGLGVAAIGTTPALAQPAIWPLGSTRFIGVFPPGGGTDILSRIWCQKMTELTQQSFIVENRAGSAGNVGTEAIARSPPDGRTIGLGSIAPLAIAPSIYPRLPYDVMKDFTYIAGLWQLPNMLVVHNDVAARTVPELIALLKANPGRYTFASSGSGTTVHLSGEMFKVMAGVDMLHVPYRGGAPAHIDLLAGRVHMIFDNIPQALAEAREGKVRALAVTSRARNPALPDVPTVIESGLKGFEVVGFYGFLAPAGTPKDVVAKLSDAFGQVMQSPEVKSRMVSQGADPAFLGADDFAKFLAAEMARWADAVKKSGAKLD